MRLPPSAAALLATALACTPDPVPNPPPPDSFYFPTGIAFGRGAGDAGLLFVASSNFDKRFDHGALTLVRLAEVGLPAVGSADGGSRPPQLEDLKLGPESQVEVQSLTGEIALWARPDGLRAFVPSRAEGRPLQFVDVDGSALRCPYADPGKPKDCFSGAPSLTAAERSETGKPRAEDPSGVAIWQAAGSTPELFVTHFESADSPPGSGLEAEAYVVKTSPENPDIVEELASEGGSFIPVGPGGTSSVALTRRWAFATGRLVRGGAELLRLVDRSRPEVVIGAELERSFRSQEARGVAVVSPEVDEDRKRLFLVGRAPDALLVADVIGAQSDAPTVRLVRELPLPAQPNDVRVIERAGRPALVAVTCTGGGVVVIYDDEVGAVVAQVRGVGTSPFGIAVQREAAFARLYVSNFGDGRVAVIDVDLARPADARLVAHLGKIQTCILTPNDPSCGP